MADREGVPAPNPNQQQQHQQIQDPAGPQQQHLQYKLDKF